MSVKPRVGFVGKPFMEFIEWLHSHDYETYLFHDKNETYPTSKHITKTYAVDFSSKIALETDLAKVAEKPDFFVNTYENAVVPKARIAAYFQRPSLSENSALWATDKFLMRSKFQENCPQYTPRFTLATSWDDIQAFLDLPEINFPLILKPANLFKSLLVTKNTDIEELQNNFNEGLQLIQKIYRQESVTFEPRFVLEEYLDGPSYSLEVFADKNGDTVSAPSAVDLIMGRDLGENDNYNYSRKLPSQLSQNQQDHVRQAAIAGVTALGLTSSPAHVELIYTSKGPKLIEIGARTGGYRQRMHLLAEDVDLFQAQVDVAQGNPPTLTPKKNHWCATYEVFCQEEGYLKEISHIDKASKLPSMFYLRVKTKVNEKTGPSKKGYRAAVVAIFVTDDQVQFKKDTTFFETHIRVVIK